ncbi:ABC transporter permease [Adhaeribacter sp. BT258]|uniref:Transport permease protein n=1 Tax=Adhaeribacter terrigena TaxID=2793070 RepID=A0ABS1BXV4_9BACT|nr:ABC transporter permease [Adhaeribacter terrigena]MBK0401910.1 ABC transporter permease [Adhaeribacter terrigena]
MIKAVNSWDWEIGNKTSFWSHTLKELWAFRHLLAGLVRRHFLLNYQQTVLGPLWILFQPTLTLATYLLVFHKLVGISTGSVPPVLFYLAGIILWNFFNDSFTGTSSTFKEHAHVFSKVYFPRIIMPVSVISTQLLRFAIQFIMLLCAMVFYSFTRGFSFPVNSWLLTIPFIVLNVGAFSLGLGLIFSVLTAKYRDMTNLANLGVRLLMFLTPVIYPLATIPENVRWLVQLNPLTPMFELFRLAMLGEGTIALPSILYSLGFTFLLLTGAWLLFNKQGDKLIDIV